jgi:predicted DNA-binding transcriptional regulator AlpA
MKTRSNSSQPLSFASVFSGVSVKGSPQLKPRSDNSPDSGVPALPQSPYGYMRQKELMEVVPFSPATLWRLVKAGKFVRPVKLSDRITAWNRAEVQAWLLTKEGK